MCASCPFRQGSEFQYLRDDLTKSAISEASRICHSTGSNGLKGNTGKPERVCRGARDVQIQFMCAFGVIAAPTDKAWAEKWNEISK